MTEKEKIRIQTSETFLLSAILALSGGFQDAYTYNVRNEVFSNAQTGNVVLMSQHLMMGEWMKGLSYLFPILSFALGVLVAERIGHRYKKAKRIHWRQLVVMIEIIILFVVGFIPHRYDMIATMLVSFSCSMQVQSFRKVNGYGYASTMCIGNMRSGTEALCAYFHTHDREVLKKALDKFVQEIEKAQKQMQQPKTYRGKQSIKHLMSQNAAISNIEVTDGNIKSFERVARKYNVDFAVKKDKTTDPPKYVVFFKGRDADAVAQAFKEFVYGNEKKKGRTSVREKLKHFREAVSQDKNRERSREKNKDRGQSL